MAALNHLLLLCFTLRDGGNTFVSGNGRLREGGNQTRGIRNDKDLKPFLRDKSKDL